MVSQVGVTKTISSRRRKLRIRLLKYTCQTKTQITQSEIEMKTIGNVNESTTKEALAQISVVTGNDIVSTTFGGKKGSMEREDMSRATRIAYGSVSVIGKSREMEDAVRVELGLVSKGGEKYDFFGVYDGHGGAMVAEACRDRLHEVLAEQITEGKEEQVDWDRVMEGCFVRMDEEVVNDKTMGSTAVVALVGKEEVVVGNCGDSRAVLSKGGAAVALSTDHKVLLRQFYSLFYGGKTNGRCVAI